MSAARAWTDAAGVRLAEAGLLREAGGCTVVQGVSEDPLSGRSALFVRWLPDTLAGDGARLDALLDDLLAGCPVDEVVLRLPAGQAPPPGWRRRELYLRWTPGGAAPAPPRALDGVTVGPASGDGDREFVVALLTRALCDAYGEEVAPLDEAATAAYVSGEILGAQDAAARSWVAREDSGRRTGHITVLEDTDDLTDQPFLECLDMFVLEEDRAGPSSRLLVGAATAYARQRALPLFGHVICSAGWEDVAARLRARGWADDYSLWVRPAASAPPEVTR